MKGFDIHGSEETIKKKTIKWNIFLETRIVKLQT
jgi:hypothetical protein